MRSKSAAAATAQIGERMNHRGMKHRLSVGDSVETVGEVIRNEDAAIGQHRDIRRSSPLGLVIGIQPAFSENLLTGDVSARRVEEDHVNAIARVLAERTVPRTVFSDDSGVAVLSREHVARVENHARSGNVGSQFRSSTRVRALLRGVTRLSAVQRVIATAGEVGTAAVAEREAEVLRQSLGDDVQFIIGPVIAPVCLVRCQ